MVEEIGGPMLSWFKGKSVSFTEGKSSWRAYSAEGVAIAADKAALPGGSQYAGTLEAPGVDGLLAQLDDEGLTVSQGQAVLIPWGHLFQLLDDPNYRDCCSLLGLPQTGTFVPALQSRNTLTDRDFDITPTDWCDHAGKKLRDLRVCGGVAMNGGEFALLSKEVWETLDLIRRFQNRPEGERDPIANRRHWARIRKSAVAAGARLDSFLFRNVILTPEKLDIGLRAAEAGGTRVVEVIPSFEGAPDDWLQRFDEKPNVPDVYNIPTSDGIVQVVVPESVRTVLATIKRFPGRRVAGSRAEAFLVNPFGALGEAATETIDEAQFLGARERAGLLFDHFVVQVGRDAFGYPAELGLRIESLKPGGGIDSEIRTFIDDVEACRFLELVEAALAADRQLCAWHGYDFEILGNTPREIARLREALEERRKPRILINQAAVYDLACYSARIEGIGAEKPYYSPFIARKNDGEGWLPENIVPVVSWVPEGEEEAVAVPITPDTMGQIKARLDDAKAKGEESFVVPGFDKPLPVSEAEAIVRTFEAVDRDVRAGKFDPVDKNDKQAPRLKKQLVVKSNIQAVDYGEARREILSMVPKSPQLPSGLREDVALKSHQLEGVAWLQHLFERAPDHCRGAVLADDMGLGKTLQLLAFLAHPIHEAWSFGVRQIAGAHFCSDFRGAAGGTFERV
jgi:hypothetical protein